MLFLKKAVVPVCLQNKQLSSEVAVDVVNEVVLSKCRVTYNNYN